MKIKTVKSVPGKRKKVGMKTLPNGVYHIADDGDSQPRLLVVADGEYIEISGHHWKTARVRNSGYDSNVFDGVVEMKIITEVKL